MENTKDTEGSVEAKHSHSRLFLPSLSISYFATSPMGILTALFLLKMAETFGVGRGFMGQINTLSSIASFVSALSMGVLSARFRHKSLLLIGLTLLGVSAAGCYLAWDFSSILLLYSLTGAGTAMAAPMAIALVGEHLALEKKARGVGWVLAGGSMAYVIGAPIMGILADYGGWRMSLLGFAIPLSALSLMLAFAGVPSESPNHKSSTSGVSYLEGLRKIMLSRSAVGCLIGNALRSAAFIAILLYSTSFFIQRFDLTEGVASFVLLAAASCYTLGSVAAGFMVNRYGRKLSTVLTALLAGLFTMSFACVSDIWLSLALDFTAAWFMGMVASASYSLTLEQVPEFRGSMMSLSQAAVSLGSAAGAAIGGVALVWYDYDVLGVILGGMGIVAAVVYVLITREPVRK